MAHKQELFEDLIVIIFPILRVTLVRWDMLCAAYENIYFFKERK